MRSRKMREESTKRERCGSFGDKIEIGVSLQPILLIAILHTQTSVNETKRKTKKNGKKSRKTELHLGCDRKIGQAPVKDGVEFRNDDVYFSCGSRCKRKNAGRNGWVIVMRCGTR